MPINRERNTVVFAISLVLAVIMLIVATSFSIISASEAHQAASKATTEINTSLQQLAQDEQLLSQLNSQSNSLNTLVMNNQKETVQITKVISDIEGSLNKLCAIEHCNGNPISSNISITPTFVSSPIHASMTTTSTTVVLHPCKHKPHSHHHC